MSFLYGHAFTLTFECSVVQFSMQLFKHVLSLNKCHWDPMGFELCDACTLVTQLLNEPQCPQGSRNFSHRAEQTPSFLDYRYIPISFKMDPSTCHLECLKANSVLSMTPTRCLFPFLPSAWVQVLAGSHGTVLAFPLLINVGLRLYR